MLLKKRYLFFVFYLTSACIYAVDQSELVAKSAYIQWPDLLKSPGDQQDDQWLATHYLASLVCADKTSCYYDPEEALTYLKIAVDGRYAPALAFLGNLYFNGLLVPQDSAAGLSYTTQAAQLGNMYACYLLGYNYLTGTHVQVDSNAAVYWLTQAAVKGHCKSQYLLGYYFQSLNNLADARRWYKQAADQAHPESCFAYACLERAQGNYGIAQEYLKKAIQLNYKAACCELGSLYVLGKGVKKDYDKAYKFFCYGAQLGDERAAANKANLEKEDQQVTSFRELLKKTQDLEVKEYCASSLKLLGKNPESSTELFMLAESLLKNTKDKVNLTKAVECYEKILTEITAHNDPLALKEFYTHIEQISQHSFAARCYIVSLAVRGYYPRIPTFESLIDYFEDLYKQSIKQNRCLSKIGLFKHLELLVDKGSAQAAHLLAYVYMMANNYYTEDKVTLYVNKALELGSTDILSFIISLLDQGIHLSFYTKESIDRIEKLCLDGNNQATFIRAIWHVYGDPLEQDLASGLESLNQVVHEEPNNASAHYYLAYALRKSFENTQDEIARDLLSKKIINHLTVAAQLGFTAALFELGSLLRDGLSLKGKVIVTSNPKAAYVYLKQAADKGHRESLHLLGLMYYFGTGISKDYSQAVELFKKSYKAGFNEAINSLGLILLNKQHSALLAHKDMGKLFEYVKSIADDPTNEDCFTAASFVIEAYSEGCGVKKDTLQALQYAFTTLTPLAFTSVGTLKNGKLAFIISRLISDTHCNALSLEAKKLAYKLKDAYFSRYIAYLLNIVEDKNSPHYEEAVVGLTRVFFYGQGVAKDIKQSIRYAFLILRDEDKKQRLQQPLQDLFKGVLQGLVQELNFLSKYRYDIQANQLLSLLSHVISESCWSDILPSCLVS
ncbi:sel1 repeat family protein [Candidatus Dependentiae bacterium]|nr:sel1 repeat family protein [Candidatus Dependentiae bacterium]